MIGASSNPEKASHGIMQKLQHAGYRVIPVNPRETEVLGERSYPSLIDVPERTANFAWGGDDYRSLFITASTSLYRTRTKVPGRPVF